MLNSPLNNKNIILAITGGIAAYKTPIIVRRLKEKGANVKVIITESGKQFVSTLSLETVSNNRVVSSLFKEGTNIEVEHISLADKSDFIIIAPATANIIGKLANGLADDFLTSMILAYNKKILIVPAMNVNMYNNPIVQKNMEFLKSFDNISIMDADSGELACGYTGKGRMPDPDIIVKESEFLLEKKDLAKKDIIITAGATKEAFDSVRYLTNHSSGKMGYSLAQRAIMRGANVKLISSKNCLELPYRLNSVEYFTDVDSLKKLVDNSVNKSDLLIMAVAVGDYKFKNIATNKVKKEDGNLNIELIRTTDILKSIKDNKNIFKIGFAAETDNHLKNAGRKLEEKGLNAIILNDVSRKDIGFKSDFNQATFLYKKDDTIKQDNLEKMSKMELADKILDLYLKLDK